jgi:hypothetical protein
MQTVCTLMGTSTERKMRSHVSRKLQALPIYHDGLPLTEFDNILASEGFSELEGAIYCGRDGQSHVQVGSKTWFTFTWHKMESGRYEVVAYVS